MVSVIGSMCTAMLGEHNAQIDRSVTEFKVARWGKRLAVFCALREAVHGPKRRFVAVP